MRVVVFAFLALFFSCSTTKSIHESTPSDVAYQIIWEFSKEMEKEGFHLSMAGGKFGEEVEKFNLGFHVKKRVDISEARKIAVSFISQFTNSINNNKQLRSFLKELPFHEKRMSLHVHFVDANNHEFTDMSIANIHVIYINNIDSLVIHYDIYDVTKNDWIECFREDFEDAKKILHAEK